MVLRICLFLLTYFAVLSADPWGKDADLAGRISPRTTLPLPCSTPILGQFGECMIHFHQTIITPIDGPRSHYLPSSSQYTLDAMRKYGFFKGFTMGCDRLMRENEDPWVYPKITDPHGYLMKYNPVR